MAARRLHWSCMLERDLQDYLFTNPAILFADQQVDRRQREVYVQGRRIDLLFDVAGIQYIVELKRDTIKREHIGQIFEYYGLLRQANQQQEYRMILVAPVIPTYRRIPLEEFGIRCVEVPYPDASLQAESERPVIPRRAPELSNSPSSTPLQIRYEELTPPAGSRSLQLCHHLLRGSLPAVQKTFSPYEVIPIRMKSSFSPDLLCIPGIEDAKDQILSAGAWWAFSFGQSETMPKNDVPNLSVNALPWGLDIAVNAELLPSQRVMRNKVARSPEHFDRLVREHGSLRLQAWLKLEHQPRFYHWIPLCRKHSGDWDGSELLSFYQSTETTFKATRERWIEWIKGRRPELTTKQLNHMEGANQNLNLALRLVHTIAADHPLWRAPYREQTQGLVAEYENLRPLIRFFLSTS